MPMKKTILLLLTLSFVADARAGIFDGFFSSSPSEFTSTGGGFSVKTPVTLKESITTKNPVVSSDGKSVELTVHQFDGSKASLAYSVAYNDYPEWVFTLAERPAVVEALLSSAGLGMTKLLNGKILLFIFFLKIVHLSFHHFRILFIERGEAIVFINYAGNDGKTSH